MELEGMRRTMRDSDAACAVILYVNPYIVVTIYSNVWAYYEFSPMSDLPW